MTELKFQQQLIDDIKKDNRESYAIKVNHRFLAGIPDLLIKHPDYEPLFVETKIGKVGSDGNIKINTTAIQRNTMRNMSRAGLRVAVWTLVKSKTDSFIVRSNWESVSITLTEASKVVYRTGRTWPVDVLLSEPANMSYIDT